MGIIKKGKYNFVTKHIQAFKKNVFGLESIESLAMDEMYFRQHFTICRCFIWNSLDLMIFYEPQNYWKYLGFRNKYILSTFDQVISLNWEYYPEQCPILLLTVYWDNWAGYNINDTRVQSPVSFILLELCARCIVPPWYIKAERGKKLLSWSLEISFMRQRQLPL